MKMVQVQGGLGFGIDRDRLIFVFTDEQALRNFVEQGWEFGGQRISTAPMRFDWMNPGETDLEAATRYVVERKLNVAPTIFLALAEAEAAGRFGAVVGKHAETSV